MSSDLPEPVTQGHPSPNRRRSSITPGGWGFWRRRSSTAHPPSPSSPISPTSPVLPATPVSPSAMSETDDKSVKSRRRNSSFAGGQAGATWFRFLHAAGLRPGGAGNRDSVIEDEPPSPTRSKRASQPPPVDAPNDSAVDANETNTKDKEKNTEDNTKSTKLPEKPPAPPPIMSTTQTQIHPPLIVADGPPPSAHDAVVANFVRPAPERSQSSPALGLGAPAQAVPPLAPSPEQQEVEDARPVSSMLDGALEPSGTRVTRALGSQIEAVLRAQEEIGKRHLALEGWRSGKGNRDSKDSKGSRGDKDWDKEGKEGKEEEETEGEDSARELEKRAKGVEDIMARLGELSVALKTYHSLGTPSLVFRSKPSPTPPAAPTHAHPDDRQENGFAPLFQPRSHQPPRKLAIRTDLTDDQSPVLSPSHPPYVTIARPGTAAPPGIAPMSADTLTPGTIGPGAIGPGGLVGGERAILVGEKGSGGLIGPRTEKGGKDKLWTQDDLMSAPATAVPGLSGVPGQNRGMPPKRIPGLPTRSGSVPRLLGGLPVQSPETMEARDRPW